MPFKVMTFMVPVFHRIRPRRPEDPLAGTGIQWIQIGMYSMLLIDKVFVLHVKKGYEDREKFIIDQFRTFNIDFEFILDGDIGDLTDDVIKTYFSEDMHGRLPAMSCAMKHILAHERIVAGNYRNALIFEDDVVLDRQFETVFNQCMKEVENLPGEACVYYSNACNMYVPASRITKGRCLYKADKSRAADSYSISRTVAEKRLDFIRKNKCSHPIDHQFNHMDPILCIASYWCHPTIVEQGSMNGLFDSAIDFSRKNSFFRKLDWTLQKLYKKHIRRVLPK